MQNDVTGGGVSDRNLTDAVLDSNRREIDGLMD